MSFIQAIILGIVQGLTEFLPISSSAHLVLVPHFLGWNIPETQIFPFDVLVQLGTLTAVILYYWKDLITIIKAFFAGLINRKPFEDPNSRLGWYLILASIPAGFAGVLLKSKVEAAFNDPMMTAYFLFATAALLILAEVVGKRTRKFATIKWFDALWIGLFQAISIFPGISRSGSTIAGGMTRGLERPAAARFSFLMSIPVMLGAGLVSLLDVFKSPGLVSFLPIILVGFVSAMIIGYLSIHWLLGFLGKRSLYVFAGYCVLLGAAVLFIPGITNTPTVTPTATVQPTEYVAVTPNFQSPVFIEQSTSLDWLIPAMSTCADTIPGFSIIVKPVPSGLSVVSANTIRLVWGEPDNLQQYSALLGTERLAVVVNPVNPVSSLPLEIVHDFSSGKVNTWGEIFTRCPECLAGPDSANIAEKPITLNVYPNGDDSLRIYVESVMDGNPIATSMAILNPSGLTMRESVNGDPAAVGFLPAHFLTDQVKEVPIANFDPSLLIQPILAISDFEPVGSAADWLVCIKKVLNP
jgi:undecaprenyl-diphosphatase